MIIAQISDSHLDPDDPDAAVRSRDLERCVADINGLDPLPDVVIHTGDLAHNGDEAKYAEARRILSRLRPPLLVGAGNRDERDLLHEFFPAGTNLLPGTRFRQYSVNDYPVRLIAVDTISDTVNQGGFCTTRANSLRDALASQPDTPTAIFTHHPPFEVHESKYPQQFNPWSGAEMLAQAISGFDHVVRGFCGHAHRDVMGEAGGVLFSSTPSVAIDLRLGDFPEEFEGAPLYRLHTFNGRDGFESETRAAGVPISSPQGAAAE